MPEQQCLSEAISTVSLAGHGCFAGGQDLVAQEQENHWPPGSPIIVRKRSFAARGTSSSHMTGEPQLVQKVAPA